MQLREGSRYYSALSCVNMNIVPSFNPFRCIRGHNADPEWMHMQQKHFLKETVFVQTQVLQIKTFRKGLAHKFWIKGPFYIFFQSCWVLPGRPFHMICNLLPSCLLTCGQTDWISVRDVSPEEKHMLMCKDTLFLYSAENKRFGNLSHWSASSYQQMPTAVLGNRNIMCWLFMHWVLAGAQRWMGDASFCHFCVATV